MKQKEEKKKRNPNSVYAKSNVWTHTPVTIFLLFLRSFFVNCLLFPLLACVFVNQHPSRRLRPQKKFCAAGVRTTQREREGLPPSPAALSREW